MISHILIVSQYFAPDITAAAHRITDLKHHLETVGHRVDVITSHPHRSAGVTAHDESGGIVRVRLPVGARSTAARLWEQAQFALKALVAFARLPSRTYETVIVTSPPLFAGVSGAIIARWAKAKFVLDVRDIWPGSVASAGLAQKQSLSIRLAAVLERWLYRRADYITCVSKPMKQYIAGFADTDKISVVYNGVNVSRAVDHAGEPLQTSPTTQRVGVTPCSSTMEPNVASPLQLVYAGNLGLVQDVDVLIRGFWKTPAAVRERLRLRIIGDGAQRERLEALARTRPEMLDRISFEGPYPKHVLDGMLRTEAGALLIHLRKDEILDRTIPSKVFDCCLFNVPIVYGLAGEGRDILRQLPGTVGFEQGSAASLARALSHLVENYDELLDGSRAHRNFVEQNFSREVCFQPLVDLFESPHWTGNEI